MLTVQYARAVPEVKFNAVEPGYTGTELGGVQDSGGPAARGQRRPFAARPRNPVRGKRPTPENWPQATAR